MLNCKQSSQLMSQSLDRKLSLKERFGLLMHLMMCKYCKRFSQQLLAMRTGIKCIAESIENDDTIKMPSDMKARIAEKIQTQQK